ncbi:MAG: DUF5615 family PIN-like protein [Planctomycetaceae bacterium]
MLSGLADQHVKAAIVAGLLRHGMDVVTAFERNLASAEDEELLEAATAEGRLMLTNDTDFLRIHSDWMNQGRSHIGIVFWRQDLPIGEAIRRIVQYALQTPPDQAANMVKFL